MKHPISQIKKEFPLFKNMGAHFAYLDSAATAQKPRSVIDCLKNFYLRLNSNVHRSVYPLSEGATEAYEDARARVARFIGAKNREEIIFTKGTTEAINLVAYSWGEKNIRAGDEILISIFEHHSNLIPWQQLAKKKKAVLKVIDFDERGMITVRAVKKMLSKRTKLVAVTHISNVTGAILSISEIVKAVHKVGARILIDAAQSVAHVPINVAKLDCDFLAFSGHKMYGPTGIGVLYGKRELLEGMEPFMFGGGMVKEVNLRRSEWADLPHRFESGTPPIAEAVALVPAIEMLEKIGFMSIQKHERRLTAYALKKLAAIPGLIIHGPRDSKAHSGIIAFSVPSAHAHDLATICGEQGVAIRAGHHCAQPLHERLGAVATCRASLAIYNSKEDIDLLVSAIKRSMKILRA